MRRTLSPKSPRMTAGRGRSPIYLMTLTSPESNDKELRRTKAANGFIQRRFNGIYIYIFIVECADLFYYLRREQNRLHARNTRERKKMQLDQSHGKINQLYQEVNQRYYDVYLISVLIGGAAEGSPVCNAGGADGGAGVGLRPHCAAVR